MKKHVENIHEGVRYPCLQCEYASTTSGHLKRHVKSKHEGVRYPCSQCAHAATTASNLKTHVKSKHEEVQYPCPKKTNLLLLYINQSARSDHSS